MCVCVSGVWVCVSMVGLQSQLLPRLLWVPPGSPSPVHLPQQGYSLRASQALVGWLGPAPGGWAGLGRAGQGRAGPGRPGPLPLLAVVCRIFSFTIPLFLFSPRVGGFLLLF